MTLDLQLQFILSTQNIEIIFIRKRTQFCQFMLLAIHAVGLCIDESMLASQKDFTIHAGRGK